MDVVKGGFIVQAPKRTVVDPCGFRMVWERKSTTPDGKTAPSDPPRGSLSASRRSYPQGTNRRGGERQTVGGKPRPGRETGGEKKKETRGADGGVPSSSSTSTWEGNPNRERRVVLERVEE